MIRSAHRFHGHGSLKYVYTHGKMVRGTTLSLKFIVNPRRTDYRLAIVVSRKVSKSAVVRNRIRRRIYEILRQLSPDFTAVYDMTLLVYDEKLASVSTGSLGIDVQSLLQKAGILSVKRTEHAIVDTKE